MPTAPAILSTATTASAVQSSALQPAGLPGPADPELSSGSSLPAKRAAESGLPAKPGTPPAPAIPAKSPKLNLACGEAQWITQSSLGLTQLRWKLSGMGIERAGLECLQS